MLPSTVDGFAKGSAWAKIGEGLPIPCTQVRIVAIPQSVRFGRLGRVLRRGFCINQAWLGGSQVRVAVCPLSVAIKANAEEFVVCQTLTDLHIKGIRWLGFRSLGVLECEPVG